MDDDLENVQRYPVDLWPEPSWFEPLYPYYCHYQGPYRVAVVLGRGKLAKIEAALSNWLIELGGYQVKLLGEQLRKDGALRPRDPRGQVRFAAPGFRSSSRCCSGDRRGAGRGEGAEG